MLFILKSSFYASRWNQKSPSLPTALSGSAVLTNLALPLQYWVALLTYWALATSVFPASAPVTEVLA